LAELFPKLAELFRCTGWKFFWDLATLMKSKVSYLENALDCMESLIPIKAVPPVAAAMHAKPKLFMAPLLLSGQLPPTQKGGRGGIQYKCLSWNF
jgi:hypothetical protein